MSIEQLAARKTETQEYLQKLIEERKRLEDEQIALNQKSAILTNTIIATQASLSTLSLALGEDPLPGTLPEPLAVALGATEK